MARAVARGRQNAGKVCQEQAVMSQLSLEQDTAGQPGRRGSPSSHRWDPGGILAPGGAPTLSQVGPLSSVRTGAKDVVRPEQAQSMLRCSSLHPRFPSSSASRTGWGRGPASLQEAAAGGQGSRTPSRQRWGKEPSWSLHFFHHLRPRGMGKIDHIKLILLSK